MQTISMQDCVRSKGSHAGMQGKALNIASVYLWERIRQISMTQHSALQRMRCWWISKMRRWVRHLHRHLPVISHRNMCRENQKKLHIPQITDRSMLKPISDLEYWTQYDEKCMSCGGCNTVCGTCSCFDTVDVIYQEGSRSGERRRVWSSCMLESYTMTAGGNRAQDTGSKYAI